MSREALRAHLWGEEAAYLDHETAINACIRRLRAVLGDDASEPTFILTLPGTGYRFIAPVSVVEDANASQDASASVSPPTAPIEIVNPGADGASIEGARRDTTPAAPTKARLWPLVAILGLAILASLGWMRTRPLESTPAPASESTASAQVQETAAADADTFRSIVVVLATDFSRSDFDEDLAMGLMEAFRIGLEQSPEVQVMPRQAIRSALTRMERDPETIVDQETALEIAQRDGASTVAVVTMTSVEETDVFSVDLLQADAERIAPPKQSRAQGRDQILGALDQLIVQVRSDLKLAVQGETPVMPLAQVTTSNLDALRLFSRAWQHHSSLRFDEAVRLLEEATDLDSGFAMAHAVLGIAYRNLGRRKQAVRSFSHAQDLQGRLSGYESLYVMGWLATIRLQVEDSIRLWSTANELYPNQSAAYFNLASALLSFENDFSQCAEIAWMGYSRLLPGRGLNGLRAHRCLVANEEFASAGKIRLDEPTFAQGTERLMLLSKREYANLLDRSSGWYASGIMSAGDVSYIVAQAYALEGAVSNAEQAMLVALRLEEAQGQVVTIASHQIDHIALQQARGGQALIAGFTQVVESIEGAYSTAVDLVDAEVSQTLFLLSALASRQLAFEVAKDLIVRAKNHKRVGAHFLTSYECLAEAEVLASKGETDAAIDHLEPWLLGTEAYPLHAKERLASWYRDLGERNKAARLEQWILGHRGRAVSECLGGGLCLDQMLNAIAVGRAAQRLGEVDHEAVEALRAKWDEVDLFGPTTTAVN